MLHKKQKFHLNTTFWILQMALKATHLILIIKSQKDLKFY